MKLVTVVALVVAAACAAQYRNLYQIDQPVPVSLEHGQYCVGVRLWGKGGVMARFAIGLFDRVTLGMSYSADSLIGNGTPTGSRPRPEFQARLALLEELGYVPDLVLGFESQGYDDCLDGEFVVREKGGYLCVGKTIDVTHTYCALGLSYWDGVNAFLAVNEQLPNRFEVIAEFDPALYDIPGHNWRGGFLNFGLAWSFAERFRFAVALRDILGNRDQTRQNRVIDLSFSERF